VSWNLAHGELYSIQHYVIKFVSDFSPGTLVKIDCHDIIEILLKVAINTITLTRYIYIRILMYKMITISDDVRVV
jgi:hypothetical protein